MSKWKRRAICGPAIGASFPVKFAAECVPFKLNDRISLFAGNAVIARTRVFPVNTTPVSLFASTSIVLSNVPFVLSHLTILSFEGGLIVPAAVPDELARLAITKLESSALIALTWNHSEKSSLILLIDPLMFVSGSLLSKLNPEVEVSLLAWTISFPPKSVVTSETIVAKSVATKEDVEPVITRFFRRSEYE